MPIGLLVLVKLTLLVSMNVALYISGNLPQSGADESKVSSINKEIIVKVNGPIQYSNFYTVFIFEFSNLQNQPLG